MINFSWAGKGPPFPGINFFLWFDLEFKYFILTEKEFIKTILAKDHFLHIET